MPQAIAGLTISDTAQINPGVIVNADINDNAAIAYSKLNLATSIVNADIAAGAAIADTKLEQIATAQKVSGAALISLNSIPANAGVIPVANTPTSAGAWVYVETLTFSAESGTKVSSALAAADLFLIKYQGTQPATASDQTIVLRLNEIAAANYNYHQILDVTISRQQSIASILLHTLESNVGDRFGGEIIIGGKHINGEKFVALKTYTAPSAHKAMGIFGGILRSNSADLSKISIVASAAITGKFAIYSLSL